MRAFFFFGSLYPNNWRRLAFVSSIVLEINLPGEGRLGEVITCYEWLRWLLLFENSEDGNLTTLLSYRNGVTILDAYRTL